MARGRERQLRELVERDGHLDMERSICNLFPLVAERQDAHVLMHPRMRAVREELARSIEMKISRDVFLRRGRAWFFYYKGGSFGKAYVSWAFHHLVPFGVKSDVRACGEGHFLVTVLAC